MTIATLPRRLGDVTREMVIEQQSLDYVRFLGCMVATKNAALAAADVFRMRWPESINADLVMKAAVAAGTTTDATWAGPLAPVQPLVGAFLEYLRPLTIVDRVPGLRRVPANVAVPVQTGGGVYGWIGQNAPAPVTSLAFATTTLGLTKAGGIVYFTEELARAATVDMAVVVRNDLATGLAAYLDVEFVNPARAPVANTSPGSITNGVTPIAPSGTTTAALKADVGALMAQWAGNNPNTTAGVLLFAPREAGMLNAAMQNANMTPTIDMNGIGRYAGYPTIVSANVGTTIVMLNAALILMADGGLDVQTSREATLQADSAPDNPPTASTIVIPLWPNNLVAYRGLRDIVWKKATTTAVSLVSPCAYVGGT